jgi:hypothetical protein
VVPLLLRKFTHAVHKPEGFAKIWELECLSEVVLVYHIPSIHLFLPIQCPKEDQVKPVSIRVRKHFVQPSAVGFSSRDTVVNILPRDVPALFCSEVTQLHELILRVLFIG